MTEKYKHSTGGLLNFTRDSYLERTARPVYAIVFLIPFIIFYEIGTILINTNLLNQSQIRVVAFVWMQGILRYLGFGSKLSWAAPPVAVIIILIALQIASRKKWGFNIADIFPMTVECVLLAVPLIVLSLFLNSSQSRQINAARYENVGIQRHCSVLPTCSIPAAGKTDGARARDAKQPEQTALANIVTAIGAGIYEELIFRLILICLLMMLFQDVLHLSHKSSIILSVLVSAALFSAHHHVIFIDGRVAAGAVFSWTEFVFRTIAGVYFAITFAVRGFGITAGTHIFYDIIAIIVNNLFFQP